MPAACYLPARLLAVDRSLRRAAGVGSPGLLNVRVSKVRGRQVARAGGPGAVGLAAERAAGAVCHAAGLIIKLHLTPRTSHHNPMPPGLPCPALQITVPDLAALPLRLCPTWRSAFSSGGSDASPPPLLLPLLLLPASAEARPAEKPCA